MYPIFILWNFLKYFGFSWNQRRKRDLFLIRFMYENILQSQKLFTILAWT